MTTLLSRPRRFVFPQPPSPPGFTVFEGPEGRSFFVDDVYRRYLESHAPQPTLASLQAVLAQGRQVKVTAGGIVEGRPLSDEILFETSRDEDLRMLREVLRVKDGPA